MGSHLKLLQINMDLINMYEDLVVFPTVGAHVITSPPDTKCDDFHDVQKSRVRFVEQHPLGQCD